MCEYQWPPYIQEFEYCAPSWCGSGGWCALWEDVSHWEQALGVHSLAQFLVHSLCHEPMSGDVISPFPALAATLAIFFHDEIWSFWNREPRLTDSFFYHKFHVFIVFDCSNRKVINTEVSTRVWMLLQRSWPYCFRVEWGKLELWTVNIFKCRGQSPVGCSSTSLEGLVLRIMQTVGAWLKLFQREAKNLTVVVLGIILVMFWQRISLTCVLVLRTG